MVKRYEPHVLETVQLRRGESLVGFVQQRRRELVERNGGETFASWVRKQHGAFEYGAPLEFSTYRTRKEAEGHVRYALRKLRRNS